MVDASADRFQDQLKSILFVEKQQPSDNVVRCVSQIADYDAHYVSVVHVEQRDDLLDDDDGVEGDNEQPVIEVAKRVIFEFHPAPRKVNTHKEYGKIVVADIFFHEKLEVYITCTGFRGCTSIITGCVYVALLYAGEALRNSNPQNNIRSWDGFFFFRNNAGGDGKSRKSNDRFDECVEEKCGIGDSFLWLMIVL